MRGTNALAWAALLLTGGALLVSARAEDEPQTAPAIRSQRWEVELDAPVQEVWQAFTTKAGIESWMVPVAEVDLRVGGTIRTNYTQGGKIGDAGTITHTILSFEPGRMYSARTTPPENAPFLAGLQDMWGVTYFDELGPERTRVRGVMLGGGDGPDVDRIYDFFEQNNPRSLAMLRKRFPDRPRPAGDALAALAAMQGEWIHEADFGNGRIFRVRNQYRPGPGGKSVLITGWQLRDGAMALHMETQVFHAPNGETRFHAVDEHGGTASGTIRTDDGKLLTWDWNETAQDGKRTRFVITTASGDADAYTMKFVPAGGSLEAAHPIDFRKVDAVPDAFLPPTDGGK